ncbi:MAG: hypothetical protein QY311_02425 [Candidatus Paceibacterota bacterium]|nr:MAG: hypothetical protein QY311_02425 [Candidatus Paceibacterota bacterium]
MYDHWNDFSSKAATAELVARTRADEVRPPSMFVQLLIVAVFLGALIVSGGGDQGTAQVAFALPQGTRVFEGDVVRGMTLVDALNAAAMAGNITLRFAIDEGRGMRIMALDGIATRSAQVAVPVKIMRNTQAVDVSKAHAVPIRPGDMVSVSLDE